MNHAGEQTPRNPGKPFPDYLAAETERVLNRCRTVQSEGTASFVFITAVLFSHVSVGQEGVFGADHPVENEGAMWGIIAAYRHGRAFRAEATDGPFGQAASADFAARGPGRIAGCFFGHVHFDQTLEKDGIPLVSTLNATTNRDFEGAPERIAGSRTETAFDVVTIDPRRRTIHLTRFGAGEDRIVRYG
ncbi:hypothetical protein [Paenibacillus sp. GYB003]|uniref:hypothetical protein n=1 Tax=Paenibacillus sp. GYB003 TaxID=2994392 RepID=UPI002F96C051